MLTSIILALSVSTTPVTPVDSLDLLPKNTIETPEVVGRKSVRVGRKSVRVGRKSVRVGRKSVRVGRKSVRVENTSPVTTAL